VKACRPQSQIGSIDRFTTVQGFAANHEQGRVNLVKLSKEQRAVFTHAFRLLHRPKQAFSQEEYFGKFIVAPLTNAKGVFRKTRCRPGQKFAPVSAPDFTCTKHSVASDLPDGSLPADARPTGGNASVAHDKFAACFITFALRCIRRHSPRTIHRRYR
jgi:hypothetical protein